MSSNTKQNSWLIPFVAIVVTNFIFCIGFYALEPTLPLYVASLGASDSQVGLVATGYFLAAVITRIFIGLFVEKVGRKNTLRIGMVSSVVFMLLYQLTRSAMSATCVRILQGCGYGLVTTMFGSIAADILPKDRHGEGIGYLSMSTTLAVSFSPALALGIVDRSGFYVMFLLAAIALAIATVIGFRFISTPESLAGVQVKKEAPKEKLPFWRSFYDPRVTIPALILLLFGISRSSEQTFLPLLAKEQALTALSVFFVIKTWVCFASKFVTGKFYDRFGPGAAIIPGGVCMAICLGLYSITSSNVHLLIAAVFSGLALGQIVPAFQAFFMDLVGRNRSLGNGLFYNSMDLGASLGGAIMGAVSGVVGYRSMFRICMFLMIIYCVGFVVYWSFKKKTFEVER